MVLLEVLQNGSIGYGGRLIPPGETFLCEAKYVEDIVARKLAKRVNPVEDEDPAEAPTKAPVVSESEASKAEDRKNLIDELVNLGITPAAKTNTKTLRGLVERARMEARQ